MGVGSRAPGGHDELTDEELERLLARLSTDPELVSLEAQAWWESHQRPEQRGLAPAAVGGGVLAAAASIGLLGTSGGAWAWVGLAGLAGALIGGSVAATRGHWATRAAGRAGDSAGILRAYLAYLADELERTLLGDDGPISLNLGRIREIEAQAARLLAEGGLFEFGSRQAKAMIEGEQRHHQRRMEAAGATKRRLEAERSRVEERIHSIRDMAAQLEDARRFARYLRDSSDLAMQAESSQYLSDTTLAGDAGVSLDSAAMLERVHADLLRSEALLTAEASDTGDLDRDLAIIEAVVEKWAVEPASPTEDDVDSDKNPRPEAWHVDQSDS